MRTDSPKAGDVADWAHCDLLAALARLSGRSTGAPTGPVAPRDLTGPASRSRPVGTVGPNRHAPASRPESSSLLLVPVGFPMQSAAGPLSVTCWKAVSGSVSRLSHASGRPRPPIGRRSEHCPIRLRDRCLATLASPFLQRVRAAGSSWLLDSYSPGSGASASSFPASLRRPSFFWPATASCARHPGCTSGCSTRRPSAPCSGTGNGTGASSAASSVSPLPGARSP